MKGNGRQPRRGVPSPDAADADPAMVRSRRAASKATGWRASRIEPAGNARREHLLGRDCAQSWTAAWPPESAPTLYSTGNGPVSRSSTRSARPKRPSRSDQRVMPRRKRTPGAVVAGPVSTRSCASRPRAVNTLSSNVCSTWMSAHCRSHEFEAESGHRPPRPPHPSPSPRRSASPAGRSPSGPRSRRTGGARRPATT
jgi:hypothetical protein